MTTQLNAKSVERAGRAVNGALWVVFALVAYFSAGNVFELARGHDTPWYVAWVLAPIVDVALFAAFNGDAILARWGIHLGFGWPTILRIFTGAATWLLNTWQSLGIGHGPADSTGIVLHSIPPAVLILLAESAPVYRAAFARALSKVTADEERDKREVAVAIDNVTLHFEARIAAIEESHRVEVERLQTALQRARQRTAKAPVRPSEQTTEQPTGQADLSAPEQVREQNLSAPTGQTTEQTPSVTAIRTDEQIVDELREAWAKEIANTGKGLSRYRVETDGKCSGRQAKRVLAALTAELAPTAVNVRTTEEA